MPQTNDSMPPELSQSIAGLRTGLLGQMRLLDSIIGILVNHESAIRLRSENEPVPAAVGGALSLMLQAAGSSSGTLASLSESVGLHTRDCYSVARSIVEVSINACFIMAEGPTAAERAMRHARQKSHRDMNRESRVGDSIIRLTHDGALDPETIEGLPEEVAEFTSRSGREKGWTDLSVDARLEVVRERLGESVSTPLHFARFAIYRHSSEIIHGTLFGCLYFFGQTAPGAPSSVAEFIGSVAGQHAMILFMSALSLSAVVSAFHSAYGFSSAHEESERIVKGFGQLVWFRSQPAEKGAV